MSIIKNGHALTITRKMSGTGSIHDLASDQFDRTIVFDRNNKYAVVQAAYYGGRLVTKHRTSAGTIRAARALGDMSFLILDENGNQVEPCGDRLVVVRDASEVR